MLLSDLLEQIKGTDIIVSIDNKEGNDESFGEIIKLVK